MNKLLVALGLAATVALVGCNRDQAPETGATTGEHLENAAEQAGHDISGAAEEASAEMDEAAAELDQAADNAAAATSQAWDETKETTKDATATAAGAVEQGAANVREEAQQ